MAVACRFESYQLLAEGDAFQVDHHCGVEVVNGCFVDGMVRAHDSDFFGCCIEIVSTVS